MKKLLNALLTLGLVFLLMPAPAWADGPDLTIGSLEDFNAFAQGVAGGNTYAGQTVKLTADITLASGWTPVGWHNFTGNLSDCKAFAGAFDGDGHTITLPAITGLFPYVTYYALFARNTGTIENLTVSGGALANTYNGSNFGNRAFDAYFAGVAAYNSGTVKNCNSSITFNGNRSNDNRYFAGIVALNAAGGVVEGCGFTGSTTSGGSYKAGIVARNYGTVKHCWSNATIHYGNNKGGIVAANESGGVVSECYYTGSNRYGSNNGGIVCENKGTVSYCFFDGALTGDNRGALVNINSGTLEYCYSPIANPQSDINSDYFRPLVRTGSGTMTGCYYDNQANKASSQPGIGLPTVQMTQTTALDSGNMDGLGGGDVWTVKANLENADTVTLYYPQLKYFADKDHEHLSATGYRLNFDANGGVGSVASVLQRAGEAITVPGGTGLTPPAGQYFDNWNTVADGSGTAYEAGSSFTASVHSTLYAQYTTDHKHPVCGASCGHDEDDNSSADHEPVIFTAVESDSAMPGEAGSYYLTQDVTLDAAWTVPSSTTTLCLNGFTLKGPIIAAPDSNTIGTPVIQLNGGSLNICDCQGGGKVDRENHVGIRNNGSGTLALYGGTVSSGIANTGNGYFAIVNQTSGKVVVNGGAVTAISNSRTAIHNQSGGAVEVKSGSVSGTNAGINGGSGAITISGGTVHGNSWGMTFNSSSCAVNISGGVVSSNGIVLYQGGGTANISGGSIVNTGSSTAIYFYDLGLSNGGSSYTGTLNISGNPVISSGAGSTYDIHLHDDRIITITGELTNTAPYRVDKVGGTAGTVIARGGGHTITAAEAAKFTAAGYAVVLDSTANALKLAHSHPVCGAECSHDANGDGNADHEDVIYQPLSAGSSTSFSTSGSYYLAEDITLSQTFHVSSSTDPAAPTVVNLCLNGHKLSRSTAGRVIEIGSGATLNICDCNGSGGSHLIPNPATVDDTSDTVNITGGVISGGTKSGVVVFGTLNLYGGSIAGNSHTDSGGGVSMSTGIFNMYGGTITANRAGFHGGGVQIYGEFAMYGGAISGNSAASNGGGVHANRSDQTYYIYGGTISADGAAYAVYSQNGKFAISGSPVISGGPQADADIYLRSFPTSSIIIAGALTNTAPYRVHKQDAAAGTVIATADTAAHADASKFACVNTGYSLAANATASGDYPRSVYLVAATYTVTLELDGGTIASGKDISSYTFGVGATLPAAADITRGGFTFGGWYDNANFTGDPVTGISATASGPKTYYAKWTALPPGSSSGGSGSNGRSYPQIETQPQPEGEQQRNDPFIDVRQSDWFYDDVLTAYADGLINGRTANTYVPDGSITIAEAVKLAACLNQLYHTGRVDLTNGSPPQWYSTYVDYAIANGIIAAGQFSDYNAIATRAEFAKIFAHALPAAALPQINDIKDEAVPDVKLSDSYGPEVYLLYRAGILRGNDARLTFAPGSDIKRSEAAAIVIRMMHPEKRVKL